MMIMFIVMTKFVLGQLAYIQKPKQFWKLFKLITNPPIKKKRKFSKISKKSWDENVRLIPYRKIPGFCKNTVPYSTGMKFLIPLEPAHHHSCHQVGGLLDSKGYGIAMKHGTPYKPLLDQVIISPLGLSLISLVS